MLYFSVLETLQLRVEALYKSTTFTFTFISIIVAIITVPYCPRWDERAEVPRQKHQLSSASVRALEGR